VYFCSRQHEGQPLRQRPTQTTTAGVPVGDNQNSITAGPRGPLLVQDWQLFEKIAQFNREQVPERVVHAKGSGAHGTFTVTGDLTRYSRASVFAEIGEQTDCLVRFSTVAGERRAADAARDVRGFAIKFYTDQGNWDLVRTTGRSTATAATPTACSMHRASASGSSSISSRCRASPSGPTPRPRRWSARTARAPSATCSPRSGAAITRSQADPAYGAGVAERLGLDLTAPPPPLPSKLATRSSWSTSGHDHRLIRPGSVGARPAAIYERHA